MKKCMLRRANTHILVLISLFFFFSRHREHSKCITTKKEKEIASLLALFGWFIFVCCSPFFFHLVFNSPFFSYFANVLYGLKQRTNEKVNRFDMEYKNHGNIIFFGCFIGYFSDFYNSGIDFYSF